jgi:hypothetical protein
MIRPGRESESALGRAVAATTDTNHTFDTTDALAPAGMPALSGGAFFSPPAANART